MTTVKLVPSSYTLSDTSYLTIANASNMYTDTSSTTSGTCTHTRASTYYTYYLYLHNFNFDTIPNDAIVSSFSVKIKASATGQSTSSSYRMSLYNNTTSISNTTVTSSLSTSTQTFTFPTSSLQWSTLKGYGNNFRIRIPLRRSSSGTSAVVTVYGAEIEVTYTLPVYHTVSVTNSTSATVSPTGTDSQVLEGTDYTVTLNVNDISGYVITDNNINVTSSAVQHANPGESASPTFIPSSFDSTNSSYASVYTGSASDGLAAYNSSSRFCVYSNTGASAESYLYYNFDCSSIPSNAIISSVTCLAGAACYSSGSYFSTRDLQLCVGTTAKGTATTITGNGSTNTSHTINGGTSWSRSDLDNLKLRVRIIRSTSNTTTDASFSFWGATLTVNYSLPGEGYYYTYTISNVQADHTVVISTGQVVNVTGVSLNKNSDSIQAGTTTQLIATVAPSNATNQNVTWSSSNTSIATVNSSGLVTGVSAGSATITVTTVDGSKTATCAITVTPEALTDYILTNTLYPGKQYIIANGNSGSVYMMSNESGGSRQLVGVSTTVSNNKISINAATEARVVHNCVQYTTGNSITTTFESNNTYLYSDSSTGLRFQSTNSLDRFWHYNNTKFWQFKSTSSDGYTDTSSEYKYYLQVSNGNFTDNHVSTTSIEDSSIPAMYLFVKDDGTGPISVTGVNLDKVTASIEVGSTTQLTATITPSNATDKSVTWSSSNISIATVSSSGLVTGTTAGTATITVTTTDGSYTATCVVTVTAAVLTDYILTNTLQPGREYLIVNGNSGSVYMMSNEANGSRTLKGIAATVSNNKISINEATAAKVSFNCVLYTTGNSVTTTIESNNTYLYSDSGTGLRFQSTNSLDRFWHYEDNKFWQFKSTSTNGYTDTSSEYKYYLEWDNSGNFTDNHLTSPSVQDTTIPTVYLFVKDDGTIPDTILYVKQNGTWTTYTKAYIKVNGSWVQQNDLSAIFNSTTHYIKGN